MSYGTHVTAGHTCHSFSHFSEEESVLLPNNVLACLLLHSKKHPPKIFVLHVIKSKVTKFTDILISIPKSKQQQKHQQDEVIYSSDSTFSCPRWNVE